MAYWYTGSAFRQIPQSFIYIFKYQKKPIFYCIFIAYLTSILVKQKFMMIKRFFCV